MRQCVFFVAALALPAEWRAWYAEALSAVEHYERLKCCQSTMLAVICQILLNSRYWWFLVVEHD